ncbi:MAG: zf-HC2 domain-containing protein [Candidatus Rokubacteria bacterium]|nr:zf-HC2 domain-containing protein [Candidatus Rokubacteria bacterium]
MNCRQIQERLVDLLYEELDHDESGTVTAHLESCAACQARWARIRAVATAADRWSAPAVSRGIAERALVRVAVEQRAERTSMVSSAVILGRALLGGGAALVSLLLVAGVSNRPATTLGMAVLAVIWTVLYSAVLLTSHHPSVRAVTRAALAGVGVGLVLAPVLTIPGVVEACARWMRAAQGSTPWALVLVVAAAGYTAAPLLLGALATRSEQDRHWVVEGLKLSGLYSLLIAPAVYLQCVALPLEVTAVWMAGALLGAAAAGPLGLRLGGWLEHAAAK